VHLTLSSIVTRLKDGEISTTCPSINMHNTLLMSIMTNKNCPFSEIRCSVVHNVDAAPIWVF
jgi:hypothetical protein